jgi:hypothetical protein
MKTIPLMAALALLCFSASAEVYYTYNQSIGFTRVDGDPGVAHPTEWQLWTIGHRGPFGTGEKPCGVFVGSSAEEVMKFLKWGQKAELDWEKVTGLQETRCSFFNYIGPIAIFERPDAANSQKHREAVEKLKGFQSQLSDFKETYETIKKGLGKEEESYKVGSVFKEYMDNLKDGFQIAGRLRATLQDTLDSGLYTLNQDFEEIKKNIDIVQRSAATLGNKTSTGPWESSAKYEDLRFQSNNGESGSITLDGDHLTIKRTERHETVTDNRSNIYIYQSVAVYGLDVHISCHAPSDYAPNKPPTWSLVADGRQLSGAFYVDGELYNTKLPEGRFKDGTFADVKLHFPDEATARQVCDSVTASIAKARIERRGEKEAK